MITHDSPEAQRVASQVCADANLAELDGDKLFSPPVLLGLAVAELSLLVAEMENPTPEGIAERHASAVYLASRILHRIVSDEKAAQS